MNSQRAGRRRLGSHVPDEVLGRPVPARFRRWQARLADPDRLLSDFIEWIEEESPAQAPPREEDDGGLRQEVQKARATEAERAALVQACIEVHERMNSSALQEKIELALETAGVTRLNCDGEPFDPERHHAVGQASTSDASLHNRIASTERDGYVDRGRTLIAPEVIVYQLEGEPA